MKKMTTEEMNQFILKNMRREVKAWQARVDGYSPTHILMTNAKRWVFYDNVMDYLVRHSLSDAQCRALINIQDPLDTLYTVWHEDLGGREMVPDLNMCFKSLATAKV